MRGGVRMPPTERARATIQLFFLSARCWVDFDVRAEERRRSSRRPPQPRWLAALLKAVGGSRCPQLDPKRHTRVALSGRPRGWIRRRNAAALLDLPSESGTFTAPFAQSPTTPRTGLLASLGPRRFENRLRLLFNF